MRRIAFTKIAVGCLLLVGCQRQTVVATPLAPNHFAVVLERNATGWRAHCDTGCSWTDVSLTCAECDIRLDASGIARAYPAGAAPTPGFEFVVEAAATGWSARGVRGVEWQALTWTCQALGCRGRIDEAGVGRADGV